MWRLVLRWTVVCLFVLVLVSWGISFVQPHGITVDRGRQYRLVAERGTIQFWTTTLTALDLSGVGVVEMNYADFIKSERQKGTATSPGPRFAIMLSPWQWYSTASVVVGQSVPTRRVNGKVQSELAGYKSEIRGIPHWLVAGVLLGPLIWILIDLRTSRRRQRAAAGQCIHCGYDLRATPERCPECGHLADK